MFWRPCSPCSPGIRRDQPWPPRRSDHRVHEGVRTRDGVRGFVAAVHIAVHPCSRVHRRRGPPCGTGGPRRCAAVDEQRSDRRSIALRHRRIGQAYAHPEIADFPQAIWHFREAAETMEALGDETAHARVVTTWPKRTSMPGSPMPLVHAAPDRGHLARAARFAIAATPTPSWAVRTPSSAICRRGPLLSQRAGALHRCWTGRGGHRDAVMLLQNELGDAVARKSREDDAGRENTEGQKP